ncbi:MAG TPA: hypothetical protein EYN91_21935 [Candidatus Melainabacteria bacterium]|jgi:hypothetical protein|nr:hypothetical protein [Candidatus Melainabacteria bacterium]HIN66293.1 hypothetical protein [Candidatus Obscuribacterales bacterium]
MNEWTTEDVEDALCGHRMISAQLIGFGDIEVEYQHVVPGQDVRSKFVFKRGSEAFDTLTHYTGELVPGQLLDLSMICQAAEKANRWKGYDLPCLQDGFEMGFYKSIERLENGDMRLYRANVPGSYTDFPSTSEQGKFLLEKFGPIEPGKKVELIS